MGDPAGEGQLSIILHMSIFQGWCKRGWCCCRTLCWARGSLNGCISKDARGSVASHPIKLQLGLGRKKPSYMREGAGKRSGCWPRKAGEMPARLKMSVGASVLPQIHAVPYGMCSETPVGHPAEQGDQSPLSHPSQGDRSG